MCSVFQLFFSGGFFILLYACAESAVPLSYFRAVYAVVVFLALKYMVFSGLLRSHIEKSRIPVAFCLFVHPFYLSAFQVESCNNSKSYKGSLLEIFNSNPSCKTLNCGNIIYSLVNSI